MNIKPRFSSMTDKSSVITFKSSETKTEDSQAGKEPVPITDLFQYVGLPKDYPANLVEQEAIKFIHDRTEAINKKVAPQYDASWNLSNQGKDYEVSEEQWQNFFPGEPYPTEKKQRTNLAVKNKLDADYIDFKNDPDFEAKADAIWKYKDRFNSAQLKRQMEGLYRSYHGATQNIEFKKAFADLKSKVDAFSKAKQFTLDLDHPSLVHPFIQEIRLKADKAKSDIELDALNIKVDKTTGKRMLGLSNVQAVDLRATTTSPAEAYYLWECFNGIGDELIEKVTGQTFAEAELDLFLLRVKDADLDNRDEYGDDISRYKNPYEWALYYREIDPNNLLKLMEDAEKATRPKYQELINQLDEVAAERFGIKKSDARKSWFQTAYGKLTNRGNLNKLAQFNPDSFFVGVDVKKTLMNTARMQGVEKEMRTLLKNSHYYRNGEKRNSLYYDPKIDKGKNQGAFAIKDINPPKPGRMLSNLDPELQKGMHDGLKTMNHETGHGIDYTQIAKGLPKPFKAIHTTATESHAFLQEELMINREWLLKAVVDKNGKPIFDEKTVDKYLEQAIPYSQLDGISSYRATMAIMEFERRAYQHLYDKFGAKSGNDGKVPTTEEKKQLIQDLNELWWDSRETFMLEERPTGNDAKKRGWNTLPHYIGSVAYYPNYFQAELLRAMKLKYLNQHMGGLLTPEARKWLGEHLVNGDMFPWDSVVENKLGEPLNVRALEEEYEQIIIPQWKSVRAKSRPEKS